MTKTPSGMIVMIAVLLAVLGGTAVYAQDKYALKSPSGIAFSDFKGYEDWAVVSSARTDEVLKVIVANPTMIEAYKVGVPGNGQPFPDGSKIVKLQWKPKKSTDAPSSSMCQTCSRRLSSSKRIAAISGKRRMGICALQL
jgi:Cytochrome P460